MSKQQRGLGKGISALFGEDADLGQIRKPVGYINKAVVSEEQPKQGGSADVLLIPVDLIEPNPFQPRMSFDQEALEELADSIRTLGLIQPITVRRKADGRYKPSKEKWSEIMREHRQYKHRLYLSGQLKEETSKDIH